MATADRSDIIGFRDGSPIRRHPDDVSITEGTKPMTKTEARKHIADARRSLGSAQAVLKPTPQWILDETGMTAPTEAQTKSVVARLVLDAEESLAALRRYLA